MSDINKSIIKFEIIGTIFSIILGPVMHFVYQWSGYNNITVFFASVNESTWEHLKLGFWPLFFWAIIEYFIFGKKIKNFIFAKFITLISFCILVPLFFYSYIAILKENFLSLDVSIFIISVIIAQFIGFKIIKLNKDLKLEKLGLILLLIMIIKFLSFSFFSPHFFIFKDPVTHGYGIIKSL